MLTAIPNVDRRGLRSFGLSTGTTVGAVFGLALPWLLQRELPIWPWPVAGTLVSLGAAAPMLLRPVYRAWMGFGLIMGRITTPLLMGILFLLAVTPIARLRALAGNDPLARRFLPDAKSYRISSKPSTASDLERPF